MHIYKYIRGGLLRYISINTKGILLILLLVLPERILFIVNRNFFYGITHIDYMDFVMLVYIVVFLFLFLWDRTNDFKKYYFADNVIVIMPLVILASIVPHILFGQSISNGFWVQKDFIMMLVSYYIARTAIIKEIVSIDYLWNRIYILSFFVTGVVIIQHALANYIHFLDVRYVSRFGVRITDNYTYSTILLIGSLTLFCQSFERNKKVFALIGLLMAYYHCIFISQTRIVMVAYGILTIVMAVIFRNHILKKVLYILVLFGGAIILLQSELGQYLMSALFDTSSDPSSQIREVGRLYYMTEIMKSPLLGRGYPHSSNFAAFKAAGLYDKINLNDNGMYGFAYIYGLLGIAWYIWLSIKMFICSYKAYKNGIYRFLLYSLFIQIICINIIWWYWRFSFGLVFAIMLAMMEEYQTKNDNSKVRLYFG